MSTNDLNDLNDLVTELKNTKNLTNIVSPAISQPTKPETLNEENVDDFIYRKSSILIQQGVDAIESIKQTVLHGADPETIEAYSKLMASVASSIEILNKVNLQKRKERAAKELKQMDLDTSKKLMDKYNPNTTIQNQTNILVATREEIMKSISDKANDIIKQTTIDAQ